VARLAALRERYAVGRLVVPRDQYVPMALASRALRAKFFAAQHAVVRVKHARMGRARLQPVHPVRLLVERRAVLRDQPVSMALALPAQPARQPAE
jgi:hypothetical protein